MGYKLCVMLCVGQFLRGKGHYAFVCEPTLFFHTHKITRSPHCYLVPFLHTHIPTLLCGRSRFGNLTIYVSKSLLPPNPTSRHTRCYRYPQINPWSNRNSITKTPWILPRDYNQPSAISVRCFGLFRVRIILASCVFIPFEDMACQ